MEIKCVLGQFKLGTQRFSPRRTALGFQFGPAFGRYLVVFIVSIVTLTDFSLLTGALRTRRTFTCTWVHQNQIYRQGPVHSHPSQIPVGVQYQILKTIRAIHLFTLCLRLYSFKIFTIYTLYRCCLHYQTFPAQCSSIYTAEASTLALTPWLLTQQNRTRG